MTKRQQKEGGTAWELQTAWDQVVTARASGDEDAEALAMRRYSEGLRNSAVGAAGAVLIPLDAKLDKAIELFQGARAADLDWRTEERHLRDKSADRIYSELDELRLGQAGVLQSVQDGTARLGKFSEEIETLQRRLNEIDARHDELDNMQVRLTEVERRQVQAAEADRDDIRAAIRNIEARQERYEQEHRELKERLLKRGDSGN